MRSDRRLAILVFALGFGWITACGGGGGSDDDTDDVGADTADVSDTAPDVSGDTDDASPDPMTDTDDVGGDASDVRDTSDVEDTPDADDAGDADDADAAGTCADDDDCPGDQLCNDAGFCENPTLGMADQTWEPPDSFTEEFTVVIDTTATLGAIGEPITVTARPYHNAPMTDPTYAWTFEGDPTVNAIDAADATQELTFDAAGAFRVELSATDDMGNTVSTGILLQVFDAGASAVIGDVDGDGSITATDGMWARERVVGSTLLDPEEYARADVDLDGVVTDLDATLIEGAVGELAPSYLSANSGAFGKRLLLIHPALLDPAAEITVQFSGGSPMVPYRGALGYAVFFVPEGLTEGSSSIDVLVDGSVGETLSFTVEADPVPSTDGADALAAMERLATAADELPALFDEIAIAWEGVVVERSVLVGLAEVASNSLRAHVDAFADTYESMEGEGREAFEQIALANGLDEVIAQLDEIETLLADIAADSGEFNVGPAASQRLIDIVCAAQSIADVADAVAGINETAAEIIGTVDFFPVNRLPIVGQVISFLSSLSSAIGAITDIIGIAAQFIPQFGDIEVEASPSSVALGESSSMTTTMGLSIAGNLCDNLAGDFIEGIVEQMQDALTRRLASLVPGASSAFRAANFDRDELGFVAGLVFDAVSSLAGSILDALGVQEGLEALAEKICDFVGGADPVLELRPDYDYSCGGSGDTFTCTEACVGSVTVTATESLCDEDQSGMTTVTCTCESDCDTAGARICEGELVRECQEIATGCLQLRDIGECMAPDTCQMGQCVNPDCNPGNCDGCCNGSTCVAIGDQGDGFCGSGGGQCLACTGGATCQMGMCRGAETPCMPEDIDFAGDFVPQATYTASADGTSCQLFSGFDESETIVIDEFDGAFSGSAPGRYEILDVQGGTFEDLGDFYLLDGFMADAQIQMTMRDTMSGATFIARFTITAGVPPRITGATIEPQ